MLPAPFYIELPTDLGDDMLCWRHAGDFHCEIDPAQHRQQDLVVAISSVIARSIEVSRRLRLASMGRLECGTKLRTH